MDGCVEKSFTMPPPLKGFSMNRWAVASVVPLAGSGCCLTLCSIFSNAEAKEKGSLISFAPVSSARYSRLRDMANWMTMAINGAMMERAMSSMKLESSSLL